MDYKVIFNVKKKKNGFQIYPLEIAPQATLEDRATERSPDMPGWVAAVVIACLESTSTPQTESAAVDGGVLSPRYSEAARAEVRLSGMQETPETWV